ncbi:MAG: hypothetical protein Ct9H90mP22_8360 [Gammaproteobacteria bacterium]|nr:MAG: hypothetical protein Ct9H90mP22_8360 [Gammaproteobacteria bacterium]
MTIIAEQIIFFDIFHKKIEQYEMQFFLVVKLNFQTEKREALLIKIKLIRFSKSLVISKKFIITVLRILSGLVQLYGKKLSGFALPHQETFP